MKKNNKVRFFKVPIFFRFLIALFIIMQAFASESHSNKNLYQLFSKQGVRVDGGWVDQAGRAFKLSRYQGRSLLVLIGYTSCPNLCPMITGQMKKLENVLIQKKISPDKLQILFITVDKEDTVASLQSYAQKHHLDLQRWTLAQASSATKETFLRALNLSYDQTKSGDHMRHSFSLVLIDAQGQIKKTFPNILKLEPQQFSLIEFQ